MLGMKQLSTSDRAKILHLLCEGMAIRAIRRATGVSKNTVAKLLADVGMTLPPKNVSQAVRLCGLGERSDEPLFLIGHGAEIAQRGMQA